MVTLGVVVAGLVLTGVILYRGALVVGERIFDELHGTQDWDGLEH